MEQPDVNKPDNPHSAINTEPLPNHVITKRRGITRKKYGPSES